MAAIEYNIRAPCVHRNISKAYLVCLRKEVKNFRRFISYVEIQIAKNVSSWADVKASLERNANVLLWHARLIECGRRCACARCR